MNKKKLMINITDKELDRDIINLNLPEIDISDPSGLEECYGKDFLEELDNIEEDESGDE